MDSPKIREAPCSPSAAARGVVTSMSAKVRELDARTVLELQLVENCKRQDIHPLEEAQGYRELLAWCEACALS